MTKAERIRNTVSITRPDTVKWLRQEIKAGKSLSDAIADAVEDMLRLQEEVKFLRQVLLRGGLPTAQEEMKQEQADEQTAETQEQPVPVEAPKGWINSVLEDFDHADH